MTDWGTKNSYNGGTKKETCNYCGCEFEVSIQLQDGHNEAEEYYCPNCKKEFHVRACISPEVRKLKNRTDGKTNNYDNEKH